MSMISELFALIHEQLLQQAPLSYPEDTCISHHIINRILATARLYPSQAEMHQKSKLWLSNICAMVFSRAARHILACHARSGGLVSSVMLVDWPEGARAKSDTKQHSHA